MTFLCEHINRYSPMSYVNLGNGIGKCNKERTFSLKQGIKYRGILALQTGVICMGTYALSRIASPSISSRLAIHWLSRARKSLTSTHA